MLANNEDPDEMPHNSISSGSALFAVIKTILRDRNTSFYRNFDWQPLKTQNGQSQTFCINMYGKIHQNDKGYGKRSKSSNTKK